VGILPARIWAGKLPTPQDFQLKLHIAFNSEAPMTEQPMTEQIISAHLFISGRVQGVGYRAATADMAHILKLGGWVRNLHDGRVEAVFEGDRAIVEEMIRWCRQGSPAAVVEAVAVEYSPAQGLKSFELKRSQ
jgi:acylphosphatase